MALIQESWAQALEGVDESTPGMGGLMEMVPVSLAPSTLAGYADKFSKWKNYCTEIRNPAVPYLTPVDSTGPADPRNVRQQDVYLYIGYLKELGTIQPQYFSGYVSVINTVHIMCRVPPPIPHDYKGALPGKIIKGGRRLAVWGAREEAPSLDKAGRRYGHDVMEEDQLQDVMRWAKQPNLRPADLRAAAFVVMGLLYYARDDTLVGINFEHLSWGQHGLRLFESRFKAHAESAGARVLYTGNESCEALEVVLRWYSYLESRQVPEDWHFWRMPGWKTPSRKEHVGWVRRVLEASGAHMAFDFKADVHMLRATACCHSLALQIPRPTAMSRGGWEAISSLDNYARPVFCGPTSEMFWGHLRKLLNTASS